MAQPTYEPLVAEPHSGWGIASFIVSLVANIGLVLVVLLGGIAEVTTPGGLDEDSLAAGLLGLLLLSALCGLVISLVLGIVGLVQQQRKKVFAILGTVFSGVSLAGGIVLMFIGFIMEG